MVNKPTKITKTELPIRFLLLKSIKYLKKRENPAMQKKKLNETETESRKEQHNGASKRVNLKTDKVKVKKCLQPNFPFRD